MFVTSQLFGMLITVVFVNTVGLTCWLAWDTKNTNNGAEPLPTRSKREPNPYPARALQAHPDPNARTARRLRFQPRVAAVAGVALKIRRSLIGLIGFQLIEM